MTATLVDGALSVTAIAAGGYHSLALIGLNDDCYLSQLLSQGSSGRVLAFGWNNYGGLGTGDTTNR